MTAGLGSHVVVGPYQIHNNDQILVSNSSFRLQRSIQLLKDKVDRDLAKEFYNLFVLVIGTTGNMLHLTLRINSSVSMLIRHPK